MACTLVRGARGHSPRRSDEIYAPFPPLSGKFSCSIEGMNYVLMSDFFQIER